MSRPVRVLLFSATAGYRHRSIAAAGDALSRLAGLRVRHSEDPALLRRPGLLDRVDVVAFLSVTGDVLDDPARQALRRFVEEGGGFVGIHAAANAEPSWDWYGHLLGARFAGHPDGTQQGRVTVQDAAHPSTSVLPATWHFTDEWYAFADVRPGSTLLLSVDGSSYRPGRHAMPPPHPQCWCRPVGAGRSWYTALGHDDDAWTDLTFQAHVAGGLRWAGRP